MQVDESTLGIARLYCGCRRCSCSPVLTPLQAQVRGVYPVGMSATNSGVTPEAGISYSNLFVFFSRDEEKGPHGEILATGQNSIMMDMNSFVWVSKKEIELPGRSSIIGIRYASNCEQLAYFGHQRCPQRRWRVCGFLLSTVHSRLAQAARCHSSDLWVPGANRKIWRGRQHECRFRLLDLSCCEWTDDISDLKQNHCRICLSDVRISRHPTGHYGPPRPDASTSIIR